MKIDAEVKEICVRENIKYYHYSPHCPKNNRNLRIKTEPSVTVGAKRDRLGFCGEPD